MENETPETPAVIVAEQAANDAATQAARATQAAEVVVQQANIAAVENAQAAEQRTEQVAAEVNNRVAKTEDETAWLKDQVTQQGLNLSNLRTSVETGMSQMGEGLQRITDMLTPPVPETEQTPAPEATPPPTPESGEGDAPEGQTGNQNQVEKPKRKPRRFL